MVVKIEPRYYRNIGEMYSFGMTLKEIASEYSVSRETIAKIIRKTGVHIVHGSKRLAERGVTTDFFNKDTEEAAYFFGLLLADGNISDRGKVSIALQSDDAYILQRLVVELNLNSKVRHEVRPTGEKYSQLCFTVKAVSDCLLELGMNPRKSLTEVAPEKFLNNRNFWRGMVDGDGSVQMNKNTSPKVYLCGGFEMCNQFLNYCKLIDPNIDTKVSLSKGSLYRVTICGTKAANILKELYLDSNFHLNRKRDKALSILDKYGV